MRERIFSVRSVFAQAYMEDIMDGTDIRQAVQQKYGEDAGK